MLAVAGAVAGLSGIAVSYALTMFLNIRANPIQAVAEVIIAKTPGPVAETLIGLVGRKDKPLLVTGVSIGIVALSVLAGVLRRRSGLLSNLVFLAMGAVALAAVWSRPGGSTSILPVIAGTLTWMGVLAYLAGYLERHTAAPAGVPAAAAAEIRADEPLTGETRRGFLIRAGSVALVAAVVGFGGEFIGRGRRAVEASRRLLRLPVTSGTVPAGADVGVDGLTPWRVPNADFYRIDTALVIPSVDPDSWSLRIHGMVDREITLSYQDLLQRGLTQAWVTICCVSNPVGGGLIGNAWWSGVRIADILREAGVSPDADAVKQTSKDGWTCGTPLTVLTDPRNAMLAVAMNGRPLPVEHGFPVRMIVPGLYGYVSACKWLVDLEVTRFDRFSAYWTQRGWSEHGPVRTESRIDVPRSGADVSAGRVRVGGSAWAQHTGIEKVEFRLDGQPWREAELGRVPNLDTWVQWAGTVDVAAGGHTLAVRATDRSGLTQTSVRRDVVPNGATGWHMVSFSAS
jgi:DMSO/TMAO reductase YedYZ molybdopterin-dependent catalytic subunit